MTSPSTTKGSGAARRRHPPHALRRYRVTVIEWLSHKTVIEATSAQEAQALVRDLFERKDVTDIFRFDDSGIDSVDAEEIEEGGAQ